MAIAVIISYITIMIIEIIPLVKQNKNKESVIYSIIALSSLVISVMLTIGVKVPSIQKLIERVILNITGQR